MKLEKGETIEVESVGSDMIDRKSSISEENIPLVLSLVSRGIYSNPIGSIIREITSNCVDANTELGKKQPILVNLNYDIEDSSYYIEFIDKGIGMSEERIQNIYTNFFSSTKRATDSLIGGFGLGSKSLLSYTDIFYITTIYDNIKYEYIYYKEGDDYILSLMDKCNVLEKSGTTIKMYIKSGDESKFLNEINQQLSYFEDVYVNTTYRSYDNNFTIYEGIYFKFKSDNCPYKQMHIILGQVTYPIDYKLLGIEPIDIPVGVKFDIGELKPTLERENIKYETKYIEIIKTKIELAIFEIKDYFKDQTFELVDLREYFKKREETPYLYFNKEKDHKIKAYRKDFSTDVYIFKPLNDIKIPKNEQVFFMYDFYIIDNGKNRSLPRWEFFRYWKQGIPIIIKERNTSFTSASNAYFNKTHLVLVSKKFSYSEAIVNLDITSFKYNRKLGFNRHITDSFYNNLQRKNNEPFQIGTSKVIYKYVSEIRNYFNSIITKNYEDVPLEFIEGYKEERRLELAQNKQAEKEKVIYTDSYGTYFYITLSNLLKYKFIYYYIKKEKYDIFLYKSIIEKSNFKLTDFIFIGLSKTQYEKIKKHKLIHISNFSKLNVLQNTFYKIKLANYISSKLKENIDNKVSQYYHSLYHELWIFSYKYEHKLPFKINTHNRKHNICWKITKLFKEYLEVVDKFEILEYVNMHRIPEKHLKTIVKFIKLTKMNSNLYK